MAVGDYHKESDGKSVTLALQYNDTPMGIAYVRGWLGLLVQEGDSGDNRAMTIEPIEVQVVVPSSLAVAVGDKVYINPASVTGTHVPPEGAYSTTSGGSKIALLKCTVEKDSNNVVVGILLPLGQ